MFFRVEYKNYPLSKKLTRKSRSVAILTQPFYGIMLGALVGVMSFAIIPFPPVAMVLMVVGAVAGVILLRKLRTKKFAKYDAEYAQILQSQQK